MTRLHIGQLSQTVLAAVAVDSSLVCGSMASSNGQQRNTYQLYRVSQTLSTTSSWYAM